MCTRGGQQPGCISTLSTNVVEAKATLSAADREMKRYKNQERTDVYNRAHHIIYPSGRVPKDQRTRIAIIISGDEQIVVEDRVKNRIYSELRQKFPSEEFALMKGNDAKTMLLQMAEENYYDNRPVSSSAKYSRGASMTSKTDIDWMPVVMQPRGLADLRREDYANVGRQLGYDYMFILTLNEGLMKREGHTVPFVTPELHTKKENIWVRVRLVDTSSGNYAYRNDLVVEGKVHGSAWTKSGNFNGRLIERGVERAMTEAMNDIEIEKD